jgi:hypothetical protein
MTYPRNFLNGTRFSDRSTSVSQMSRINLDHLVLSEIKRSSKRKIVPFPVVFYRLGCIFHFDKTTSQLVLKELEKKRMIRIHNFHGVEILRAKNW